MHMGNTFMTLWHTQGLLCSSSELCDMAVHAASDAIRARQTKYTYVNTYIVHTYTYICRPDTLVVLQAGLLMTSR